MRRSDPGAGLRVERALRVLPNVDVLTPLRALLIATARAPSTDPAQTTVGNRSLRPDRLGALIPKSVTRFSEHLAAVYQLVIEALAAEARADTITAVRALVEAGARESAQGRETVAQTWLEHALHLAELASDRRAEAEALLALAEFELSRDAPERATRRAQRALDLAEAMHANRAAAAACLLLGRIELDRDVPEGGRAWFTRGLPLVEDDTLLGARLKLALGESLARHGDHADAVMRLLSAEAVFRAARDVAGVATALAARARVTAADGGNDEALILFREALAVLPPSSRDGRDAQVELAVRIRLCHHLLMRGRLVEAEDEARRAEEVAVVHNHGRELARIYLVLGAIRAVQQDESGLVFFEKALELSRGPNPVLRLEAEAYQAYAAFCRALKQVDEAKAYERRAREIRAFAARQALKENGTKV